jgi:hypothetical protein
MSIKWRRRFARVIVALLVGVLAGCARTIVSDPDTFNVPADAAKHLRAGGNVALNNAYQAETKVTFYRAGNASWVADLKQYTDTAITMLGREMQKKSVAVDPKAAKTVTLRVYGLSAFGQSAFGRGAVLILEAQYGDGTKSTIKSQGTSQWTAGGMVDHSLMIAVSRLLDSYKFQAYVNN